MNDCVSLRYADACRQHYLEYVERKLKMFGLFLLDTRSIAPWIPFGKAEFDLICQDAARHVPQFDIARRVLVRGLNKWIDRHKTTFSRQGVFETRYGASPLFVIEIIRRQTQNPLVRAVMQRGICVQIILCFLAKLGGP